jgi:hypothetical protein
MQTHVRIASVSFILAVCAGCAGNTPAPSAPSTATATDGAAVPTKPDSAAAKAHLKDHVKYPATRAEILKACADTPEFTAGEKKWFEQNLPEGTYKSADEAIAAEKL